MSGIKKFSNLKKRKVKDAVRENRVSKEITNNCFFNLEMESNLFKKIIF
jgi:hypothetical protein